MVLRKTMGQIMLRAAIGSMPPRGPVRRNGVPVASRAGHQPPTRRSRGCRVLWLARRQPLRQSPRELVPRNRV